MSRSGFLAPWVRTDRAWMYAVEINGTTPPPKGLESAALNWFTAQTGPTGNGINRAAVTGRLRAGNIHNLIWPGIIHDAIMLPLLLTWLGATGVVVRRRARGVKFLTRAERRRARGRCGHCNYDLFGIAPHRCPECGTPLEADVGPAHRQSVRRDLLVTTRRDPGLGNEP